MDYDTQEDNAAPFHGGRDTFRDLLDAQAEDERVFSAKLAENVPVANPYSPTPTCLEQCCTTCADTLLPEKIRYLTYDDFRSVCGPIFVIATCLFLIFILPWLPMAFENHRSCSLLAPDSGIIGSEAISSISEQEVELKQFIMGFDRDNLLRQKTEYDTYLYSADMQRHIARYRGNTKQIVFEELDPLCQDSAPTNGTVHFCLTPRDNIIPGAPWNRGGVPPVIDITSPQLPGFLLSMTIRLRKLKIAFPNIDFVFENVSRFENINEGASVVFTSSENSATYLRRTFYEYGTFLDTSNVISPLIWPGLATPILATGDYRNRFRIDQIPEELKDEGKFHRLCVPSKKVDVPLLASELPDDAIELFETILLSPGVSEKVAFHARASSLYKDFSGNNRGLKVGLTAFVVFLIINGGLILLEYSQ